MQQRGRSPLHRRRHRVQAGGRSRCGFADADIEPYAAALRCLRGPDGTLGRPAATEIVVSGFEVTEEQGISTSILVLLAAIPASVPEAMRPTDCAEIVASVMVLMS